MQTRLNKALADLGLCSRRKADELIAEGKVRVNGVVAVLGTKTDPEIDTIEVDGETQQALDRDRIVIALNKPAGIETTAARREDETIILDLVENVGARVFPVGRLDKASRGLILLTNDGLFAYHLTHPKFEKEKEYLVRVAGVVSDDDLKRLRQGMNILGSRTKPARVDRLGPPLLRIVLTEGKNRQIRRMLRTLNLPVVDLQRVRIGNLMLAGLEEGKWRELSEEEIAGLDPEREAASA